jgi:hypothetical protein
MTTITINNTNQLHTRTLELSRLITKKFTNKKWDTKIVKRTIKIRSLDTLISHSYMTEISFTQQKILQLMLKYLITWRFKLFFFFFFYILVLMQELKLFFLLVLPVCNHSSLYTPIAHDRPRR